MVLENIDVKFNSFSLTLTKSPCNLGAIVYDGLSFSKHIAAVIRSCDAHCKLSRSDFISHNTEHNL